MNYNDLNVTTQDQPIPGRDMIKNHDGNYVFKADVLQRFLILGTTGATYYASQKQSFNEIIPDIKSMIAKNGKAVVDTVTEISVNGRAPKNDEAIFVLALCACADNKEVRKYALSKLNAVCRIGTHLFQFIDTIKHNRGMGRLVKNAINNWYLSKSDSKLAYQLVKYQQRNGWSHKDILKLTRPKPNTIDQRDIFGWVLNKVNYSDGTFYRPAVEPVEYTIKDIGYRTEGSPETRVSITADSIVGFEKAKSAMTVRNIVSLIKEYGLTREMIPTHFMKDPKVWAALLENMPMTAMIRNLGNMSASGLISPLSVASKTIIERVTDVDVIKRSRLHPVAIMNAMLTFKMGHGVKGNNSWSVDRNIVDALEEGFYKSFDFVEPTGKNFMLGIDVSSSMTWGNIGGIEGFTPNLASSVLAMATIKSEKYCHVVGFTHEIRDLGISKNDNLSTVMKKTHNHSFGSTDCAALYRHAEINRIPVNTFVTYTDSETNAGWRSSHPSEALKQYRKRMDINSAGIVVGMVANNASIADPNDPLMLDVVGFNTNVPSIISSFG